MDGDNASALILKRKPDFVETPAIRELAERAGFYLRAGYPVHFCGPAGTGKTTLAMHVAALIGRPVLLMRGDDEFGSSDLIGGQLGLRSTKVVDNYIHSVVRTEEETSRVWVDNRLTTACRHGYTVIYDEFNRSRPEANNVLLGILEERLLELPGGRGSEGLLQVHPEFRAIFTSNPEEYAGVHKTQDALLDRMITIQVSAQDAETEAAITAAKSGLAETVATGIAEIVRRFRHQGLSVRRPTVRACVMIARVVALRKCRVAEDDPVFLATCRDILASGPQLPGPEVDRDVEDQLIRVIRQVCGGRGRVRQPSALPAAAH